MSATRWAGSIEEVTPHFEDAVSLTHRARDLLTRAGAPWRADARGELWQAGPTEWALVSDADGEELLFIDHGPECGITVKSRPDRELPAQAFERLCRLCPELDRDVVSWLPERWELPRGTPARVLWRPVGQAELDLIAASDWRESPPRLPGQPIFYPVLNEDYATRIARDWNTKDAASGNVGYVLRFTLNERYASRYPPQRVGGERIDELWIPADEVPLMNANIIGDIDITAEYRP